MMTENTLTYSEVINAFDKICRKIEQKGWYDYWESSVGVGSDVLTGLFDFVYSKIINLLAENYSATEISNILSMPLKKVMEIMEQIEDTELLLTAEDRIAKYGGWEEANKHFISESEFWHNLGVTDEDTEKAVGYDIG